jgi:predicted secreted protein
MLLLAAVALPSAVQAQTFRGDDDGDGIIVFDDFEDGVTEGEYFTFAGGGAGIGLTDTSDVPAESSGSTALSATIDGADGGGFAGYGKGFASEADVAGIDVSDLGDTPHFTMYVRSNATTEYTLEINLQEDQDGNGSFDGSGAVDDEFQYNLTVSPDSSGYTRISIPFSDFFDDNSVNSGGDGSLSPRIANVVFAIGNLPAEEFTFTVDDILYSDTDLVGGGDDGNDDEVAFRGDENGDGKLAFDDFEDGLQDDEYFTFAGQGGAISLTDTSDVPAESGGSTALAATIEGGGGGGFAGYGKGVDSGVNGLDLSALGDTPYFTMYVRSNATTEYTIEINLQEDQDGNGRFDGSGAVDDEFQYDLTVSPDASDYTFVSVPLADFFDSNAVNPGGDGSLSDRIANLVFAIGGLPAETFTFTVDDIAFTSDGSPLPVELAAFDVQVDGDDALLSWQTLSETNNARFEVQTATGTSPFRTVGSVRGAGTTTETQRYRFRMSDLTPGTHRFRLRQVDVDGTATLSDVRTLTVAADAPFTVVQATANPLRAGETATLKYAVRDREPVQVELFNVLGQRVRMLRDGWSTPGAVSTVRIPTATLTSGMYFVRITGRSFSRTERLSVVQ